MAILIDSQKGGGAIAPATRFDFTGPARDGFAVDWPIRYADLAPGTAAWKSSSAFRATKTARAANYAVKQMKARAL